MTNNELYKYLPTTEELNANTEYAQAYVEMTKKLASLQLEFGEDLSALWDVAVVDGKRYLVEDQGMTPEEAEYYELVYTIDGVQWSGNLDQLLIEWYTDEDYSSGLFEDYTIDELNKLKAMNKLMYKIDGEWDYNRAVKHMQIIEKLI